MFSPKTLILLALSTGLLSIQVSAAPVPQDDTCFINESNFRICNREPVYQQQQPTNDLLGAGPSDFGGKFETVVPQEDFANQSHFKEGKVAYIEAQPAVAQPWQP
ncbi:hypothetical protein TWF281_002874 [Arthrobotrys megalospora]